LAKFGKILSRKRPERPAPEGRLYIKSLHNGKKMPTNCGRLWSKCWPKCGPTLFQVFLKRPKPIIKFGQNSWPYFGQRLAVNGQGKQVPWSPQIGSQLALKIGLHLGFKIAYYQTPQNTQFGCSNYIGFTIIFRMLLK